MKRAKKGIISDERRTRRRNFLTFSRVPNLINLSLICRLKWCEDVWLGYQRNSRWMQKITTQMCVMMHSWFFKAGQMFRMIFFLLLPSLILLRLPFKQNVLTISCVCTHQEEKKVLLLHRSFNFGALCCRVNWSRGLTQKKKLVFESHFMEISWLSLCARKLFRFFAMK